MNIPAALWKSEKYLKEQGTVSSLATNAWTGAVAASSSSTSVASDLRLKFHYDRDMLMDLKSSRLSHVRLACLSSKYETSEGVWDPDCWFASVSSNTSDTNVQGKRKQPVDVDTDISLRKRPSGNGSKSADTADADDDDHISLAPQKSSFFSGCQLKQSAAEPISKRDGCDRHRQKTARVDSGRNQIIERLADKELRKDDRGAERHVRHRDVYEQTNVIDRRRTDRDTDDLGRGRYSRDSDNAYPNMSDRNDWFRSDRYDRGDSRSGKSRIDRDREDARYDIRRKVGRFRGKNYCKAGDLPHRDWGYLATGKCCRRKASYGICQPRSTTMNLYSTFNKRHSRMEGSCDGHLIYNQTGFCCVPSEDKTMLEPIV